MKATVVRRIAMITGLLTLAPFPLQAALEVTPTNDGTTLVNSILGSGITVVPGSISYTGANSAASGLFTGGNTIGGGGLGITSGILLTTGSAAGAVGPNSSDSYSGGGASTTLSFDFTTAGGDLFFNYVFASEEYNEYANSAYNDTFQFLLNGENIALIPGTSTPVTINNVNGGNPFGTNAQNPAYFRNNDPSDSAVPFNIQYDGLTTVFTAQKLGLGAGTHTIVLSIADVGDSSYDSAVFIQGKSFSDTKPPVTVPDSGSTAALLGFAFIALAALRRRFY